MAFPDKLRPEWLYFFVLGPGTGETVLLRIPPDRWVVMDSFMCEKRPAAEPLVAKYGGRIECIVLTHPHRDHYPGILELIEDNPEAILACIHPQTAPPAGVLTADPMGALKERAKPTYVRIWQEWETNNARRWETFRHEQRVVSDARVTSLHPVRPVRPDSWGDDVNEISSAMLVEWHGLRLLLGADVPQTQWPGIAAEFVGLGNHAAMKIPHHGSAEAIHDAFGLGPTARSWLVTPFRSQRLPRANDGEGLERILSYVNEVHLTALPFAHNCERQDPCVTTRESIRDNIFPRKENRVGSAATLDRHVLIAFDQAGNIRDRRYGPGSVRVT